MIGLAKLYFNEFAFFMVWFATFLLGTTKPSCRVGTCSVCIAFSLTTPNVLTSETFNILVLYLYLNNFLILQRLQSCEYQPAKYNGRHRGKKRCCQERHANSLWSITTSQRIWFTDRESKHKSSILMEFIILNAPNSINIPSLVCNVPCS